MEWLGNGATMFPTQENCSRDESQHIRSSQLPHAATADSMASLCQSQQQCVKATIMSSWQLVEAQDRLCGLELHGCESVEQERATALASSAELSQTEQEWRHKESMLGNLDPSRSPVLCPEASRDVFDKSIINIQSRVFEPHDESTTFVQTYEEQLKHFGMLRRWDDSQQFLSRHPHLICEDTANHLISWCFRLQAEEKEALMEQVAHQAVAMQFILEMASTAQQDPRGCFRQFFQKAKAGQEGYLDVFHTELEAFKMRVKEYTMKSQGEMAKGREYQVLPECCCLDPKEVLESLPPVAEYHVKRCLEAGLWTSIVRGAKEETTETDDQRMMETS